MRQIYVCPVCKSERLTSVSAPVCGGPYSARHNTVVMVLKSKPAPPKRSQYTFDIKHHSQLDFNEIAKDLSYAKPMAVVTVGGKTFLLVHLSMIGGSKHKQVHWDMGPPSGTVAIEGDNYMLFDCSADQQYVSKARKMIEVVKLSAWKDNSQYQGKVTVTVSQVD